MCRSKGHSGRRCKRHARSRAELTVAVSRTKTARLGQAQVKRELDSLYRRADLPLPKPGVFAPALGVVSADGDSFKRRVQVTHKDEVFLFTEGSPEPSLPRGTVGKPGWRERALRFFNGSAFLAALFALWASKPSSEGIGQ